MNALGFVMAGHVVLTPAGVGVLFLLVVAGMVGSALLGARAADRGPAESPDCADTVPLPTGAGRG